MFTERLLYMTILPGSLITRSASCALSSKPVMVGVCSNYAMVTVLIAFMFGDAFFSQNYPNKLQ